MVLLAIGTTREGNILLRDGWVKSFVEIPDFVGGDTVVTA
jgi:hypothetical protein